MIITRLSILFLFGILKTVVTEKVYTSVVQTESGPVKGQILTSVRENKKYAGFRGIPFAEPPVGYLRFKPPVEKKKWTQVFDATEEGNLCPQINENRTVSGSEDCLIINVYTPHTQFINFKQGDLKSVIVWIFGGAFSFGTSKASTYGPDFFIEEDVVIVSMNYRLGPLGLLNINHENATGNAALKDQNLALKWVKKNVVKFGGDPNKVTILGESSGGVSADLHVLSEMSTGLFHRSISMSGSPLCMFWGYHSPREALDNAFELGSKLGLKSKSKDDLLKTLYAASTNDIILKATELSVFFPFRVTVESTDIAKDEEKFLTSCPIHKYRSGNFNKHPHMTGHTSNEAKSFGIAATVATIKQNQQLLESLNNEKSNEDLTKAKEILQKFVSEGMSNSVDEQKYIRATTDLFFVTDIDAKQRFMNSHNGHPIYYYTFAFDFDTINNTNTNGITGVGHATDLPYVFYNPSSPLPINDPRVKTASKRYVRLMANFAKYGNPTPKGKQDTLLGVTWPNSGAKGYNLEINENLTVRPRPISHDVEENQQAGFATSCTLTHCF